MTHPFEIELETTLPGDVDQVWAAIATGPGIDSWFMGRNSVEPREGGRATMLIGGQAEEATVTGYEPGRRLATRTDTADDGRFMAFEYLLEGRDGGSTVLRVVHSGLLGDDWENEYDALRRGWPFHLHTLREYLTHFAGRTGYPVFGFAQPGAEPSAEPGAEPSAESSAEPGSEPTARPDRIRGALTTALALTEPVAVGDRAHGGPAELAPLDGEVVWADDERFGVRSADGLYTFHHGSGVALMFHHLFGPHPESAEPAWQKWLTGLLA